MLKGLSHENNIHVKKRKRFDILKQRQDYKTGERGDPNQHGLSATVQGLYLESGLFVQMHSNPHLHGEELYVLDAR
jgi:hypothetical protein